MIQLNNRNARIDLLRGIAILLVLILHFNLAYHLNDSVLANIFPEKFLHHLTENGNYGVTIFFAISGFLITSTSLRRFGSLNNISFARFYRFRFARIMPCLVLAITIISILNFFPLPIFKNDPHSPSLFLTILSILTFWHNYLMELKGYFNYCLNILWSLSVEEVFYIAFPITCCLLKKTHLLLLFWGALIIIGPIMRHIYQNNEIVALYGYFSCFDAIAMGCCAAVFANKFYFSGFIWKATQLVAFLLMLYIYFSRGIMDNVVSGISLMALSTSILLIGASQLKSPEKNTYSFTRGIEWLGQSSYELYLFHIIVLAFFKSFILPEMLGNTSKLFLFLFFVGLSAFIASIIEYYYAQPMNNFIRQHRLWGYAKLS